MIGQTETPIPSWLQQELRGGWLGVPEAYHPYDFLGVALGTYVLSLGIRGSTPVNWLAIGVGALMIVIHVQRFFYAPQDRAGLDRLLEALDVPGEGVNQ